MAPLHLPPVAYKSGGSALWAMAVYWTMTALAPRLRPVLLALAATLISLGVELLKLVYWPPLDQFRETTAGKLLLGRYFTFSAIGCYWLAILGVAVLDRALLPACGTQRKRRSPD